MIFATFSETETDSEKDSGGRGQRERERESTRASTVGLILVNDCLGRIFKLFFSAREKERGQCLCA